MELIKVLGMALGLGLLIGFQRQRAEAHLGGIRTFPLIALLGTVCGLLAIDYGNAIVVVGFVVVFGVLAMSNYLLSKAQEHEAGQTTEVAALLTFGLGVYIVNGHRPLALLATGVIVVLLHLKEPMHQFVEKMGKRDITALMQFVVISLIILPLLPDRSFGPYKVLNPFDIWRMVVLIVGISLTGYIIYKFVGERAGTLLGGVLGGLISSTATTVSYARRSAEAAGAHQLAAIVIMIASTVAFGRVIIEIAIVAPMRFGEMILPIVVMLIWMFLISLAVYRLSKTERANIPPPANPAELRSALVFGAIYAIILLAVGAAKQHFGESALFGVSILSGLTDMDAITLSVARMVETDRIPAFDGWRYILTASLSNLVFKGAAVALLGSSRLTVRIAILFGIAILGGAAIILFWPDTWSATIISPQLGPR